MRWRRGHLACQPAGWHVDVWVGKYHHGELRVDASVRVKEKSLHAVKEWWPASYGAAGICVICRSYSEKEGG